MNLIVIRGGGQRQQEQVGPSAKIKIRLGLEDIYNGKEIPVYSSNPFNLNYFRWPITEWFCVPIAEEAVQTTQRTWMFVRLVEVQVQWLRLNAWVQASSSNSREPAILAMVKAGNSPLLVMFAMAKNRSEAWMNSVSLSRRVFLMVMNT